MWEECEAVVTPLVQRLVGRPLGHDAPSAQYAKLSIPFVVATAMIRNMVFITDFWEDALAESGGARAGKTYPGCAGPRHPE